MRVNVPVWMLMLLRKLSGKALTDCRFRLQVQISLVLLLWRKVSKRTHYKPQMQGRKEREQRHRAEPVFSSNPSTEFTSQVRWLQVAMEINNFFIVNSKVYSWLYFPTRSKKSSKHPSAAHG